MTVASTDWFVKKGCKGFNVPCILSSPCHIGNSLVSRLKAIKPQGAPFPEALDNEWHCGGSHFGKGRTALAQVGNPEPRPVGTDPPARAVSGPPTQPPTERFPLITRFGGHRATEVATRPSDDRNEEHGKPHRALLFHALHLTRFGRT